MNPTYLSSIHHDGSARYVRTHDTKILRIGDEVTLRLRNGVDAPVERLLLRTCPDGEQHFAEMKPVVNPGNPACRWWEVTLRITMPVTAYRFLLFTAEGTW
jgi:alpha-glucosidase